MSHRTDEKVFRFLELTSYWALVVGAPVLRFVERKHSGYFMPGSFALVAASGVMFMTRYFVYAEPRLLFRRERAVSISLSRDTKIALGIGYVMCVPMFVLGSVGLLSPLWFERTIRTLSPMRLLLE